MEKRLNFDYATIHGTYWMYYGVICSFASVFLLSKNYSNSNIGIILATGSIFAVFLQPITADFADRSKKMSLIGITQIVTWLLIILTCGLFFFEKKSLSLTLIFILLIAWTTVMQPLLNSLNFKLEKSGIHLNFGLARSLGSLAYALLCSILGTLVKNYGSDTIPFAGEITLGLLLICLWLTKVHYKKAYASNNQDKLNVQVNNFLEEQVEINLVSFIKRNKTFLLVNVGVIGLFFSNSLLNNFMMQIVTNVGGNAEDMGRIISFMAALEIPTMVAFDRIRKKFKCQTLIKVASIGFTLKIALCLLSKSVAMLFFSQLMQLVSFALILPAMVHLISEVMNPGEAVKGQSLFTIMMTIGAVFASLLGGIVLDISGAFMLMLIGTIITAIGSIIIIISVDKIPNNKSTLQKENV